MKKKIEFVINPREVKPRDVYTQMLIAGATKAGVQVDRRREASRKACRGRHVGE